MLSLLRTATRSTQAHIHRGIRPIARYASDTGLGGFGALSVPIPLKSNEGIKYGQPSKSRPGQNGLKYTPQHGISAGRRLKRREHLAKRAAKEEGTRETLKGKDEGKGEVKSGAHQVAWNEEIKVKTKMVQRGRKAAKARKGGKGRPPAHHSYGKRKEPYVKSEDDSVTSAGGDKSSEGRVKETHLAPEEIEGM